MTDVTDLAVDDLPRAVAQERFERIAALTRRLLGTSVALVSIVTPDEHRVPGRSMDGIARDDARVVPMSSSICRHVVAGQAPLIIPDLREDDRSAHIPEVVSGLVQSYAGMPLVDLDGDTVGSLCVLDDHPREWTSTELELVGEVAAICSSELQLLQTAARTAVAADRDRIARDLTGDVFNDLLQLSMLLARLRSATTGDAADASQRAIDTIDRVLKNLRRTVFDARTGA